jgi:hypothetical protein
VVQLAVASFSPSAMLSANDPMHQLPTLFMLPHFADALSLAGCLMCVVSIHDVNF